MKLFGKYEINITNLVKAKPQKAGTKKYIYREQLYRIRQDLAKWRNAIQEAERIDNPNRLELYRIYADIVLDAHLTAVMSSRKNKTLSKSFMICNEAGEEVPDKTKLFYKNWFYKFMNHALDSVLYGYSLIEFDRLEDYNFKDVELVYREHVKPEFSIFVNRPYDREGINYTELPFSNWLVGVGEPKDLGLLMKAVPYVLWKKLGSVNWSEYSELFGKPFRIGRTNTRDESMRAVMAEMLDQMGSSGWGVFDKEDEITLLEISQSDAYNIYEKLLKYCSEELSKLILGQTMTTDNGSSRSQAEVHERVSEEYAMADMKFIQFVVNDQLFPMLNAHGFGLDGLYFKFDQAEKISLKDQFSIDRSLMAFYKIPESYITEKYGVPVEPKEEVKQEITTLPQGGAGAKKSVSNTINVCRNLYAGYFKGGHYKNASDEDKVKITEAEIIGWVSGVYGGIFSITNLPVTLFKKNAEYLTEGLFKGYGKALIEFDFNSPDYGMLKELRDNVYKFSAAKTYQQIRDVSKLLKKGNQIKPFNEFKKEASVIFEEYNVNYLQAEYQTAVAQAQMASRWVDIQEDKDVFPYLVFDTVGDGRVRDEHRRLEGIKKPVGDPFWKTYYPPLDWRCRCTVKQESEADGLSDVNIADLPAPNPLFRGNVGIDKKVFSEKHPYFKVPKEDKALAEANFNLPMP